MKVKFFNLFVLLILSLGLVFSGCSNSSSPQGEVENVTQEVSLEDSKVEVQEERKDESEPDFVFELEEDNSQNSSSDVSNSNLSDEVQRESVQEETLKQEEELKQLIADGVYSYEISFRQPDGIDYINLNFEVENGVVSSFEVEDVKVDRESRRYNRNFNDGVQDLVIGKKVEDINLPYKVSGASLTTRAVSEKLDEIKSQA